MDLLKTDVENTLDRIHWGTLTLESKTRPPYSVPLTFAYDANRIFIHSGIKEFDEEKKLIKGEKLEYLEEGLPVQFLVVDSYSVIPSFFSGSHLPCYASQCFASIKIIGEARTKLSTGSKVRAMNRIVRKLQPQGGYAPFPICGENKDIDKMLEGMTIIEISITEKTTRAKFCQAFSLEQINSILKHLADRGSDNDLRTMEMINKYYPFNE